MKSLNHFFLDRERNWLLPLVGLMFVLLLASRTPLDSDMWWHLRAGEITVTSGTPMTVDSLSFTRFNQTWINHSWLSQVLLFFLFKSSGYLGLGIWVVLLAVLSMVFVYLQLSGHPIVRILWLILGCTVISVVWSPRPQMASLFLFALLGYLLYLYKYDNRNTIVTLPILFALWGNLHGGFVLGFILIGAVVVGEITNHLSKYEAPERMSSKKIRNLLVWTMISFVAMLINPNGIGIWIIPFQTVDVNALQNFIEEWASPNFHDVVQLPYLGLVILILISFGLGGKRRDCVDIVVTVIFAAMGLIARRNFGPFALAGLPVLSRAVNDVYLTWKERKDSSARKPAVIPQSNKRPVWQVIINLFIVAILAAAGIIKLFTTTYPSWVEANTNQVNPSGAVAWLRENKPQGNLFNEYNWGGYLTWHLPEYKVFVDGRTDLFGDEILSQWMKVIQAGYTWQTVLDNWDVNLVLVSPDRPVVQQLKAFGWKNLYKDKVSVIYGRIP